MTEEHAPPEQTLTDFLLARIAEDEARGRQVHADYCDTPAETMPDSMGRPMSPTCDCDWHISRVLAECEAKRRIVEFATGQHTSSPEGYDILRLLALPYADHPDYREEWRP